MECPCPQSLPFDPRQAAADELLRGRDFAQQLRLLLSRSAADYPASQDLVSKILNSFSTALSMVSRSDYDEINASTVDSPSDARKPEESGESSKSSSSFKDRRGCYKRRKTSDSWTRESSSLIDDGYAWRKYGQKVILNAKFPRSYFRCTHKFDHGCQATKQVQRLEEDPPKYSTNYYGHHTCNNFLKASEIVLDSNFNDSAGVILRFDSPLSNVSFDQQDHIIASFSAGTVKKEFIRDETVTVVGSDVVQSQNQVQSSSSNYIMSPEEHLTVLSSSLDQSEHGDVFSEVMMGSIVDFSDDVLQFDF